MILRWLHARFGELPADVIARVRAVDTGQLEIWSARALTTPTLAAVLGEL